MKLSGTAAAGSTNTRAPVAEMSATEQPIASCPNTTICARERVRYRLAMRDCSSDAWIKERGVGASPTMVTTLHRSEPVFRQMPQPGLQAPVLQPRCGWGLSGGYFRSIRADREQHHRTVLAQCSVRGQSISLAP